MKHFNVLAKTIEHTLDSRTSRKKGFWFSEPRRDKFSLDAKYYMEYFKKVVKGKPDTAYRMPDGLKLTRDAAANRIMDEILTCTASFISHDHNCYLRPDGNQQRRLVPGLYSFSYIMERVDIEVDARLREMANGTHGGHFKVIMTDQTWAPYRKIVRKVARTAILAIISSPRIKMGKYMSYPGFWGQAVHYGEGLAPNIDASWYPDFKPDMLFSLLGPGPSLFFGVPNSGKSYALKKLGAERVKIDYSELKRYSFNDAGSYQISDNDRNLMRTTNPVAVFVFIQALLLLGQPFFVDSISKLLKYSTTGASEGGTDPWYHSLGRTISSLSLGHDYPFSLNPVDSTRAVVSPIFSGANGSYSNVLFPINKNNMSIEDGQVIMKHSNAVISMSNNVTNFMNRHELLFLMSSANYSFGSGQIVSAVTDRRPFFLAGASPATGSIESTSVKGELADTLKLALIDLAEMSASLRRVFE
jgi:hypothetical protein